MAPEYGPAFFFRAEAQAQAGNLDEAETLFWRALGLDPCPYMPYLALAGLLRRRSPDSLLAEGLLHLAGGGALRGHVGGFAGTSAFCVQIAPKTGIASKLRPNSKRIGAFKSVALGRK